jgi:hypothetical protein
LQNRSTTPYAGFAGYLAPNIRQRYFELQVVHSPA